MSGCRSVAMSSAYQAFCSCALSGNTLKFKVYTSGHLKMDA